jgi:signal transduction histidine kinase
VGARIDPQETMAGQVLRQMEPQRLTDATAQLRARLAESLGAQTALFVPLVYRGRANGVLAAFDRLTRGPEFHADDEHLMLSFAASAATAVATAKYVEETRLRLSIQASEQERKRWARELHDETLQGLGALRVLLSSALQSKSPEALETTVRDAIGHIGSEIENLRTLITELRPAALDELGLEPAIQSLVQRTATVQGLEIQSRVQLSGSERLGPELEQSLYRLVQESLTNISRHARASTVQVSIVERRGAVEVTVRDDGVGFDPATPVSGFGIAGMRERVALAGGELSIDSTPGSGSTITAVLPLPVGQGSTAATG